MNRIKELDSLRAFAILAVFLVHYRPVHQPVFRFMALGWSGVDLFFVISGFLITGILWKLRQHPHPFQEFYWRRALRIFPPYYLALMLILLLAYLHGEQIPRKEQIGAWFFLSALLKGFSVRLMASRLFMHAGFALSSQALDVHHFELFARGLGVFWSLSSEELFYLIWAPIVLKGSKRFVVFCSVAPLLVCPMLRGLTHTPDAMETFGFITRFDSLSAGACLALLFLAARRGKISMRMLERGALAAIPVSALALFLLSWRCGLFRNVELRSTLAFSICGYTLIAIFCAALVALSVRWSGSSRTRILRQRPLIYLGTISYMMYLIHVPVYVAAGIGLARIRPLPQMAILQGILATGCTIGLAALSWKYFEAPVLSFKDRKFTVVSPRRNPPAEEPFRLRPAVGE